MLDTSLWIVQSLLALFFFAAGAPKVIGRGIDRWVGFEDLPRALVVGIGVCEVAAAIALVAPMAVQRGEWTTPLAATGLTAVSLMASGFHIRHGEWLPATETALWALLAASVAVGRGSQIVTEPSISAGVLVPVMGTLVAAIIVNLLILLRPVQPDHRLPSATRDLG